MNKRNISIYITFIILSTQNISIAAPLSNLESPELNIKNICISAKKKKNDYQDPKKEKTNEKNFNLLTKIRPCVKTYPWPTIDPPTNEKGELSIPSSEMLKIKEKNNKIANKIAPIIKEIRKHKKNIKETLRKRHSLYRSAFEDELRTEIMLQELLHIKELDQHLIKEKEKISPENNLQDSILIERLKEGMNIELLELYGEFLYLTFLLKEEEYKKAESHSEKIIKKWNIVSGKVKYDDLEELTYFSKQSLYNFIVLLKHSATAALSEGSLEQQAKNLHEYLLIRNNLHVQISIRGGEQADPYWDLFRNSLCDDIEQITETNQNN